MEVRIAESDQSSLLVYRQQAGISGSSDEAPLRPSTESDENGLSQQLKKLPPSIVIIAEMAIRQE